MTIDDFSDPFSRLEQLDTKLILDKTFDDDDFNHYFRFLHHPDLTVFTRATFLIPNLREGYLHSILDFYAGASTARQKIMTPQLASTDYHFVYNALFDTLETYILEKQTEKYMLCDIIVTCLSKCDYPIIPGLFRKLSSAQAGPMTADYEPYFDQIKRIMLKRGFFYFRPYLEVFPQIPFESTFRNVFGNAVIDRFKKKHILKS